MTSRPNLASLALTGILLVGGLAGCGGSPPGPRWADIGGDPKRGRDLVIRYSCGSCHEIPNLENARGLVGPPLGTVGRRTVIAGVLPNTPDNMARWISHPQSVVPGNAMPDMGLSDPQARDIAAYLYSSERNR
jgi:cytochrome c